MRGEVGNEIPKKDMDKRCSFMTSHMTLPAVTKNPRIYTHQNISFWKILIRFHEPVYILPISWWIHFKVDPIHSLEADCAHGLRVCPHISISIH